MSSAIVQFLKPTKRKIVYAFVTSLLWNLFILAKVYFPAPSEFHYIGTPFSTLLWILFESLFYYPFACSLVTIYDYKNEGVTKLFEKKYLLSLVIVCLVIFNPIGIRYLLVYSLAFILPSIATWNTWSCGAYVVEIIPGSPAESSIKIGDTLIKINDRIIHNASDFIDAMNTTKAGEQISVYMLGGSSFTVHLVQSPTNQTKGFLGVRVRDVVVTAPKNPCKP